MNTLRFIGTLTKGLIIGYTVIKEYSICTCTSLHRMMIPFAWLLLAVQWMIVSWQDLDPVPYHLISVAERWWDIIMYIVSFSPPTSTWWMSRTLDMLLSPSLCLIMAERTLKAYQQNSNVTINSTHIHIGLHPKTRTNSATSTRVGTHKLTASWHQSFNMSTFPWRNASSIVGIISVLHSLMNISLSNEGSTLWISASVSDMSDCLLIPSKKLKTKSIHHALHVWFQTIIFIPLNF